MSENTENNKEQTRPQSNNTEEWDGSGTGRNNKNDFGKLKDGENNLRIITKPHRYWVHKVKFPDDNNPKGGGWTVRCAGKGCILCGIVKNEIERPDWAKDLDIKKANSKWYIGAIIRDVQPNVAKIFDIGALIRNKVKEHASNKNWGNPINYDVTVKKDPEAGKEAAMNFYSVSPVPKGMGPLQGDDLKLAEAFDETKLEELCKPKSNEEIVDAVAFYRSYLDKAAEKSNDKRKGAAQNKKAPVKPQPQQPVEDSEAADDSSGDDEDDFNIKSVKES